MSENPIRFLQLRCLIVAFVLACLTGVGLAQDEELSKLESNKSEAAKVKLDFLGDPLPRHAIARLGTNRFCPSKVVMLALSADEKIVVTMGMKVVAWDAETGKQLWSKKSDAGWFGMNAAYGYQGICRMPVSGRLASNSSAGVVDFWNFETGKKTKLKVESKHQFSSIDVSPDEKLLALGSARKTIVCDLEGEMKFEIKNNPKGPRIPFGDDRLTTDNGFSHARFTPDGKRLVLVNSGKRKTLQIVDVANGETINEISTTGNIVRFDFASDGKKVVTTERDIAARMYDIESGTQVWEKVFSVSGRDERYTSDIRVSPDGSLVAVGTAIGEDHRIQLLDAESGDSVGALEGHTWKPWCVRFTADGKRLFSSGWDSVIRRWDVEKRKQIRIENAERASAVCSMSPDGRSMVFADDSGSVHLVDRATGEKLRSFKIDETSFGQLIYSQDSKLLAGGGASKNDIHIYVWDVATGEVKHHWEWPKGKDVHSSVESLSFSRDANRLAACVFRQSACCVFDLPSDSQIAKTKHRSVYGLSLSPDGQQFVSAGWDKFIRLWDCETGKQLKEASVENPGNDDARMYGVLFAPDGKSVASLSLGGTVRIWDLELEKPILSFDKQARPIYGSFQYSRNGLWLAVGQMGGDVNVFEVNSGVRVWHFGKHEKHVYNVDFGSHDRTLLTGASDGVCYLWDLNIAADSKTKPGPKQLAKSFVGGSPRVTFVRHQQIAALPAELLEKEVLPAIGSEVESLFSQWDEFDEEERSKLNYDVHRVAMLLAQLELPAAEDLLDKLLEDCPGGAVKKTIFLAKKHRQRFLKRVASSSKSEKE
jgi:WD40 repeat protein